MTTTNEITYTVRVPAMFWKDHTARGLPEAISERRAGHSVWLVLDDEAIYDLYSDADYYSGDDWGEPDLIRLGRSARRTVANIRQQQPEWYAELKARKTRPRFD
jgi:hypothetical protein